MSRQRLDTGGLFERADAGAAANLNGRQVSMVSAARKIAGTFGKFDQSMGPDGAHYAPAAANPFKANGAVCGNCVMFDAPRSCEVVAGNIDPQAVCKLWVVPGNKITE